MTIEQMGSLGELIAAIATVITLIYLALQIRANQLATRAQARRAIRSDSAHSMRLIAQEPEVADLFRKGLGAPESLSRSENLRFLMLFSDIAGGVDSAWAEYRLGASDYSELERQLRYIESLLATPGGRFWINDSKKRYEPDMIAVIEQHVAEFSGSAEARSAAPGGS